MSEIRRVNTGDAPRNVYHAGDAPRTVNTGRTVKTGSALNQDEYEAARRKPAPLLPSSRPRKPTLPAKLPRASRPRPLPRASSP